MRYIKDIVVSTALWLVGREVMDGIGRGVTRTGGVTRDSDSGVLRPWSFSLSSVSS